MSLSGSCKSLRRSGSVGREEEVRQKWEHKENLADKRSLSGSSSSLWISRNGRRRRAAIQQGVERKGRMRRRRREEEEEGGDTYAGILNGAGGGGVAMGESEGSLPERNLPWGVHTCHCLQY